MKTIVGMYETFAEARRVQEALVNAGIAQNQISILAANTNDRYNQFVERNLNDDDLVNYREDIPDEDGAIKGALAGGAVGGIGTAIVALALPGVGPFAAAGWLLSTLMGMAAGTAVGGLAGAFTSEGIDEEDAHIYAEGVRRGYTLVTVRADENKADFVANIMNHHNALDIEERGEFWRESGWDGSYKKNSPVFSQNEIEEERNSYRNLYNRDTTYADRYDGFQEHYRNTYAGLSNRDYTFYRPHYEYGVALNETYNQGSWEEIEPRVRQDWERQHQHEDSTWEDVKDAVRNGWYSLKRAVN